MNTTRGDRRVNPARRRSTQGTAPATGARELVTHRRIPNQRRAMHTVECILDAARKLIVEEGAAGVTTRKVAERAGVSVGSLYEYFPNREALLAHLAEDALAAEAKAAQADYPGLRAGTLAGFLIGVVRRALDVERRMHDLVGDFQRRFTHHYRLWSLNDRKRLVKGEMTNHLAAIIRQYDNRIAADEQDLAAHLLAHGIRAMLAELVEDRPDLLGHPRLGPVLERVVLAIVGEENPNATDSVAPTPAKAGTAG